MVRTMEVILVMAKGLQVPPELILGQGAAPYRGP